MKKIIFTILVSFTALSLAHAQNVKSIPLYPDGIPNSKPTPATYVEGLDKNNFAKMVSNPVLLPYFPEKSRANGTAIVICPGGGYSGLSMENEGTSIAKEFNKIGVTAFILKYRLPSDQIMIDKTIGPLQDAQQAILMVRTHAAEWGINPAKIGIIGFSAGGHLASTAETHYNTVVIPNKANVSVRPDFAILMYPVITFTSPSTHVGSKENLLGKNATPAQIELYSNEKHVTADTPPTFIVQAEDDKTVPVQNSLLFYNALVENKVKAEMHLYQAGGHGFGLNNGTSIEHWFEWCSSWMRQNGF